MGADILLRISEFAKSIEWLRYVLAALFFARACWPNLAFHSPFSAWFLLPRPWEFVAFRYTARIPFPVRSGNPQGFGAIGTATPF